ncbi:hypothetical protein WJX72_001156 [[Myrmecia] bisecta]|uniref:non-specific serine/threonine protein kinase n=1 Tax=[Myrmecia] bisecta TaxID=41462 RepID=A0AAW1QQ19_9CHLO
MESSSEVQASSSKEAAQPAAEPPDEHEEAPESRVVETDPSGRYSRFEQILGRGAFKTVYKGFDEEEGIEVAWNQVRVSELVSSKEERDRLFAEIRVLKQLKHKNIMTFYDSWLDQKTYSVNFITELFTSGTLRQYRKRHKHIDSEVLKRWAWQILCGLVYLHGHTPPIIHRDLKCDNIFINGSEGVVKIGDLGLATLLRARTAPQSVLGTPEFMAPELYDEEYDDRVDVYSFGMCLLELATLEYPYCECRNAAQIYRKVTLGVRPAGLQKVPSHELAEFINVCISPRAQRPRARQLLKHPYFDSIRLENVCGDGAPVLEREFKVKGKLQEDEDKLNLRLRICQPEGPAKTVEFDFDLAADTAMSVASEMVEDLSLSHDDAKAIAAAIKDEIAALTARGADMHHADDASSCSSQQLGPSLARTLGSAEMPGSSEWSAQCSDSVMSVGEHSPRLLTTSMSADNCHDLHRTDSALTHHADAQSPSPSTSLGRKRSSSGILSPPKEEDRKLPLKKLFENLQEQVQGLMSDVRRGQQGPASNGHQELGRHLRASNLSPEPSVSSSSHVHEMLGGFQPFGELRRVTADQVLHNRSGSGFTTASTSRGHQSFLAARAINFSSDDEVRGPLSAPGSKVPSRDSSPLRGDLPMSPLGSESGLLRTDSFSSNSGIIGRTKSKVDVSQAKEARRKTAMDAMKNMEFKSLEGLDSFGIMRGCKTKGTPVASARHPLA